MNWLLMITFLLESRHKNRIKKPEEIVNKTKILKEFYAI